MIDYHEGDAITVAAPDGSAHAFRVLAVEPIPDQPNGVSLTLSRIQEQGSVPPGLSLADALAATSERAVPVGPLVEKLAAYRVRPVKVGDDGLGGLMLEHDPCVWFQLVSAKLECRLPHLLALALEHHVAGCRTPR